MSSWVKLSRKLATSAIAAKPEYLAVWVHLLMAASYKEGEILVGRQIVRLLPGQLVFGRHKFSEKTGVSESIVRSALKVLESLQQITIKSESKFSVITITKWSFYQDGSPANDQQMTSKRPADDHNKEVLELQEIDQKHLSLSATIPLEGELLPDQRAKKRAKKAPAELVTLDQLIAEGCDQQHAKDWLLVRKQKKAPLTVTAWNGVRSQASKAAITPAQAVQIAAENGWSGFNSTWARGESGNGQRAEASRKLSAVELVAARGAERERARQGSVPEYFGQGEFLDGECQRTE